MKTIQELDAIKQTLNEEKVSEVLAVLAAIYPDGKEHVPELVPVLRYVSDIMELVLSEVGQ